MLYTPLLFAQEEEEEGPVGYEVLEDRILIEAPEDWAVWEAPTGARIIRDDGTVIPRLLRGNVNAVYSAEDDSVVALAVADSNPEHAMLAVDGDPTTHWEPSGLDDISTWTFELDLQRTLIVNRIVIRFADEGEGDPFRQFRVLTSDGLVASGRAGEIFSRVGLVRNLSGQREFTFELTPQRKVAEGIEGAIVQKVRIDVLSTAGGRAEEVSPEEYALLAEEDRGDVDYFLQTSSGRLIAVSQNTYADLVEEERGPIRYHRRERPRLERGRGICAGREYHCHYAGRARARGAVNWPVHDFLLFRTFTDGLFATNKDMLFYDAVQDENQVEIDLGAKYWLDRIKLLSPDRPPFAYQMRISDGSVDANGNFVWTTFDERRNLERLLHVEEAFPRQEVRYIEFRQLEFSGSNFEKGRISEIQAYGEGYVSEITMESPFIQLDRPRLFSHVTWEGEAPPNTRIEVRTRTGEKVTLEPHYFTMNGREISEDLWRRLPDTEQTPRPPPVFEEITGPDWSNWSQPYAESGASFKSPAPRPLVKVQMRLRSREPLQRAWLRSLRLHFVPPLVDTAFGEIYPREASSPALSKSLCSTCVPCLVSIIPALTRLPCALRPLSRWNLARCRWEMTTRCALVRVRACGPADSSRCRAVMRAPLPCAFRLRSRATTGYAFRFRTRVFLQSTVFSVQLQSSEQPDLLQEVVGGDATQVVATQSLSVVSRLTENSLLEDVQIEPRAITPNGDGINDRVEIRISIYHLEREKTLGVEVFDLSGRRVRDLSVQRSFPSGEHVFTWDGRDDEARIVPPGLYVMRIDIATDSDAAGTSTARLLHVAH